MNRRYALIGVAVLLALLMVGVGAIAKESPDDEGPLMAPNVSLGEPGLSFRYVQTFGVTEEPYLADAQHLNQPAGIFVDSSNNLYVVEESGHRVLKFNAAGDNQLIVGHAGLPWHHNDYLCWPKDVAVDGSGHFWVVMDHAVKEFDASGAVVQRFPDDDPWNPGDDNEHFDGPAGIAFDSVGRLYVSDWWNHRVQVYTFTVGGSPVYSATIGVTDESGSDNNHFNEPQRIATYSNWLYIADAANHRVQIYDISTPSPTYSATIGVSGESGSDNDHLAYPIGVAVDANYIYVAEGDNNRVQIFNRSTRAYVATLGEYGDGDYQFWNPRDVAIDSAGNIFVADYLNMRVQKFNSSRVYQRTYGETGVPYATDTARYNAPWGIAVASDGSIYFIENGGYRLVKLNVAGVQQWTVGEAGVWGSDNAHFGSPAGNPAIDAAGRIYITDSWNHRIQIFNSNGTYFTTFGSYSTGNYQFECPTGVAISPVNGDIYVVDTCNQRIMVYTSSWVYKARLGETDVAGSDNTHFNDPQGVAVDQSGAIYVADRWNYRVQKCTLSDTNYTCATFAGVTGESGDDFSHLGLPLAVAVDSTGRVYVADEWNSRIQVFDSTGAYLTTIGGSGGSQTGQMDSPLGIAVDGAGNVYVTDTNNHRIQKFALGVPGWRQVNINGFGDRWNRIGALEVFGGYMYAGTWNDYGAQVWRTADEHNWSQVTPSWSVSNTAVFDAQGFGAHLYVGTGHDNGGEVWRTDGTTWAQVVSGGFGDGNNYGANAFAVFSNAIYAATSNETTGVEIWRSTTGNVGTWSQVNSDGFGSTGTQQDMTMDVYSDTLYVGLGRGDPLVAELWRTNDGTTWTAVFTDGLGNPDNTMVSAMVEFNGYFYIGVRNITTGGEVWHSDNGTSWTPMFTGGLGNPSNTRPYGLVAFNSRLYVVFSNPDAGAEVWRTADGTTWEPDVAGGWGDSNNGYAAYFGKGGVVFNNQLFFGTMNVANGGEVWRAVVDIVTPLALSAESGYASIQLTWNPASDPDVTAYRISRRPSGSPTFTVINTVSDTVYFDSEASLTPGASYCYQVEALNSGGTVVGTSNEACATFGKVNLWVPDTWAPPGETVIVPVNIRNADGLRIAASDIWLDFDGSVIEPVVISPTALTTQYAWSYAIASTGTYSRARISAIASPPPVLYGDGSLFWLTFHVLGAADDTSPLNLREFIESVGGSTISTLDESENLVDVPLFLQDGTLHVATTGMLGDVDNNGVVQAADAYLALQMAAGKKTPDWRQQYAGDVNGDGVISSADVTMILYYAAHQQWPVPSGSTQSSQAASAGPVLSLDDVSGAPGVVAITTLRASDLQDWAGGDWVIAYDPALVKEITDVSAADLSTGAPLQFYDNSAGLLRIAVARGTAVSGDGALATISLRLAPAPAHDNASLAMAKAQLNDVFGRDFSTSALQRTVTRQNGMVSIAHFVYLPLVLR